MKVILYGASGMVGQGALRECLTDPNVKQVVAIGRSSVGIQHPKLRELLRTDLTSNTDIEKDLTGSDACFFCLGTPSAGKSEADYTKVTYDLTLEVAQTLARLNPQMTFIYISGQGADSSEKGAAMWARVRGRTENALQRLPFRAVYIFRPGMIQPLDGIKSKTALYRLLYTLMTPILPILRSLAPKSITTTRELGQAMIRVAKDGAKEKIVTTFGPPK